MPTPIRNYFWASVVPKVSAKLKERMQVMNLRIMVVDDNIHFLKTAARQLRAAGFRNVQTCSSPEEALSAYPHYRPDIVISDVSMPNISGDQLVGDMVRLNPGKMPRFVFCSGLPPSEKVLAVMDKHMVSFAQKGDDGVLKLTALVGKEIIQAKQPKIHKSLDLGEVDRVPYLSSAYHSFMGRIVHKFNNVLTYVPSNLEYLAEEVQAFQEAGDQTLSSELQTLLKETTDGLARLRLMIESVKEFGLIKELDHTVLEQPIFGLMDEDPMGSWLVALTVGNEQRFRGLQMLTDHYFAGLEEIMSTLSTLEQMISRAASDINDWQSIQTLANDTFSRFFILNSAVTLTQRGESNRDVIDWKNYYDHAELQASYPLPGIV
ncbi:MAG: response regulator [bacterium]